MKKLDNYISEVQELAKQREDAIWYAEDLAHIVIAFTELLRVAIEDNEDVIFMHSEDMSLFQDSCLERIKKSYPEEAEDLHERMLYYLCAYLDIVPNAKLQIIMEGNIRIDSLHKDRKFWRRFGKYFRRGSIEVWTWVIREGGKIEGLQSYMGFGSSYLRTNSENPESALFSFNNEESTEILRTNFNLLLGRVSKMDSLRKYV